MNRKTANVLRTQELGHLNIEKTGILKVRLGNDNGRLCSHVSKYKVHLTVLPNFGHHLGVPLHVMDAGCQYGRGSI